MGKNHVIGVIAAVIVLLMMFGFVSAGSDAGQAIVIGQNGIYDLVSAVNAIGDNAGNAVIYLNGPVSLNQQVEIPAGRKGLTSVTLASYTGAPMIVTMNGSVICANGVPFTLEQGVTLTNGFLVGGKCAANYGQNQKVTESVLVVNGNADYVIGGGLAMGYGAVSSVQIANVVVNGSANIVHGGGFAYNGGVADVSDRVELFLTRNSNVTTAVYGGGYASGYGSYSPVRSVHITALGQTGKLVQGIGLAESGGSAAVGAYSLEPVPTATPTAVPTATPNPYYNGWYDNPQAGGQYQNTASTVIRIGPNETAHNFTQAVSQIPNNAGYVTFQLTGSFLQNTDVEIPLNRGILSVTVAANNGRVTVTWPEDIGFFANGIPLTISSNVVFDNGTVYGGANVGTGQQSNLQSTYMDISGTVNKVVAGSKAKGTAASAHVMNAVLVFRGKATGWIYAGGSALYGGYSVVDGLATLTMMQGSSADQSISGGGFAFGEGAQSVVKDAYLDISGSIVYAIYMGGYADQAGTSTTTGQVALNLQSYGNIGQSVWYGGRAYKNANVYVDTALAQIYGRVGATVHKEGRASDGGTVSVRVIR